MEIPATEFKANCLKLMDQVAKTHESIVITKRGKPIAKLAPIDEEPEQELFGYMAGTMEIEGDIVSPIEQKWSVLTGDEDDLYGDLIIKPPPECRVSARDTRGCILRRGDSPPADKLF